MGDPRVGSLPVDGASLYHEVRGSGPLLMLIPGGNGDAGPFQWVAEALADRFTVVTYDRRGFSRSPADGAVDDDRRLALDVADAHRLIVEHSHDDPGQAYVLGSSSGAIVGLELLCRHPSAIRVLVAHEPPLVELLPDAARWTAFFDEVYQTYLSQGVDAAMHRFGVGIGMSYGLKPPRRTGGARGGGAVLGGGVELARRARTNNEFFLNHELRRYPFHPVDLDVLWGLSSRLVLAGGSESAESFPGRTVAALADRLGVDVVDVPGGHVGYLTHSNAFADRLAAVLAARRELHDRGFRFGTDTPIR